MLSWCLCGVTTSQVTSQSNTTNTLTCTWQIQIFLVAFCSMSTLSILFLLHPTHQLQSNSRFWRIILSELFDFCHKAIRLICIMISATHTEPIQCFNTYSKCECAVILCIPGLPANNLQQSEEVSHMGGNTNCGCRKCKVGGTHEYTESDEKFYSLHFVRYFKSIYLHALMLDTYHYHNSQGSSIVQLRYVAVLRSNLILPAIV